MSFSTVYDLTESNEAAVIAAAYLLFGIFFLNRKSYTFFLELFLV